MIGTKTFLILQIVNWGPEMLKSLNQGQTVGSRKVGKEGLDITLKRMH